MSSSAPDGVKLLAILIIKLLNKSPPNNSICISDLALISRYEHEKGETRVTSREHFRGFAYGNFASSSF